MSHLPLDARAILAYLTELGYRNISAEQLREFMKDLRKLIKYEERLNSNINKDDYFEGLFRRTTVSYRAKKDKENVLKAKAKSQEKCLEKNKKATTMAAVDIALSTKISSSTFKIKSSEANDAQSRQVLKDKINLFKDKEENICDGKRLDKKKACLALAKNSCKCCPKEGGCQLPTTTTTGIVRKLVEDCKEPRWQCLSPTSTRSRSRSALTGRSALTIPPISITSSTAPLGPRSQSNECRPTSTHMSRSAGRSALTIPPISISTSSAPPLAPRSQSNECRPTSTHTSRSGGVLIPKPRPKLRNNRTSDPVKLYQYYQREWKHFRNQIPGELTRSDVRWQVRQKLLDPN